MNDQEKQNEKSPYVGSMKDMSDSDVSRLMASKYGDEWEVKDLDMHDPIVIEFFDRTSRVGRIMNDFHTIVRILGAIGSML